MQTSHPEQPFDDGKNVALRVVMCAGILFRLRPRLVFDSVDLLFDHLLDLMIGEFFRFLLSVAAHKPMNLMYDKCSRDPVGGLDTRRIKPDYVRIFICRNRTLGAC